MHPRLTDITTSVIQTLVLYSLAEHQLGHATTIGVTASRSAFSIEDNGRGHAIDRSVDGSSYLQFIYRHLDFPYEDRKARPVQLQGLGMSLLNRLCTELVVTVRKTSTTLTLKFQSGQLVSHEIDAAANPVTGNRVSGVVHSSLVPAPLDEQALKEWLQGLLIASPSLQLFFNGQQLHSVAGGV